MINIQSELTANKVYLSPVLKQLYPSLFEELIEIFKKHSINHDILWGISQNRRPKDIWSRDYMPVQTNKGFVKFIYQPDSLLPEETKRGLTTLDDIDIKLLQIPEFKERLTMERIIAEGGNFVKGDGITFICDKIFRDNKNYSTSQLHNILSEHFGRICYIPQMPDEIIGHADGYIRYVRDNIVIVNDWRYEDKDGKYNEEEYRSFIFNLYNCGLEVVMMPNSFDIDNPYSDYGDYLNYLIVDNVIIMQKYGIGTDKVAMELLKFLFGEEYIFESVDCTEISKMGGALNCCSWTINI